MSDLEWRHRAACRDTNPDLFVPIDGERGNAKTARQQAALRICADCPVRVDCLRWVLNIRDTTAVAGGTTGDERREWLAKNSERTAA